jgi:hypothetical protein
MYLDPRNTYYRTPGLDGGEIQSRQVPWLVIGLGALIGYIATKRAIGAVGGAVGAALVLGGRKP